MSNTIIHILFFSSFGLSAQEKSSTFEMYKTAYLEKWENSKNYLIAFAEAMPEEYYDFKPAEAEMTFGEQLKHINANMEWLATVYLGKSENKNFAEAKTKAERIDALNFSFTQIAERVKIVSEAYLGEKVIFFAGEKNKLQILNLIQDHLTHHRGQLVVYLNLKGIKSPDYVGW